MNAPLQAGLWVKVTAETVEHEMWRDPLALRLWLLILVRAKKPRPDVFAEIDKGNTAAGSVILSYGQLASALSTVKRGPGGRVEQPSTKQLRGALKRLTDWQLIRMPTGAARRACGRALKGILVEVNEPGFYLNGMASRAPSRALISESSREQGIVQGTVQGTDQGTDRHTRISGIMDPRAPGAGEQGTEQGIVQGIVQGTARRELEREKNPPTPRKRGDPLLRRFKTRGAAPDGYTSWDAYFGAQAMSRNVSAEEAQRLWTKERSA